MHLFPDTFCCNEETQHFFLYNILEGICCMYSISSFLKAENETWALEQRFQITAHGSSTWLQKHLIGKASNVTQISLMCHSCHFQPQNLHMPMITLRRKQNYSAAGDPVCTSLTPRTRQQFLQAGQLLCWTASVLILIPQDISEPTEVLSSTARCCSHPAEFG